jgi:hypothetical protein
MFPGKTGHGGPRLARPGAARTPAAYPCPDHAMTHSVPGVRIRHLNALSARQPQRGPTMQLQIVATGRPTARWVAYAGR